ncbi:MAG: hypothetical protein QXR53_00860 [Candidatus Norongarragalinales archaeon]
MRFKKRFVFVRIKGGLSLAQARRLFGPPLKHFDESRQEAVLKCKPGELAEVKKAFSKAVVFEGNKVVLRVRRVSASFSLRAYAKETV